MKAASGPLPCWGPGSQTATARVRVRQAMSGLGGKGPDLDPGGPLDMLITAIERAARAGWPETARLIALLAVAAAL